MNWALVRFAVMSVPIAVVLFDPSVAAAVMKRVFAKPPDNGPMPPWYVLMSIMLGMFAVMAMTLFYYALRWFEDGLILLNQAGDATGFQVPFVKFVLMIFKSMQRNMLRTSLMYLAIFVLVMVVTMIWSVLDYMTLLTSDQGQNFKSIVTEKNSIPSMLPWSYGLEMAADAKNLPPGEQAEDNDLMTWSFIGVTLDNKNRTFENSFFMFAMEPKKLLRVPGKGSMMDATDDITDAEYAMLEKGVAAMEENTQGVVLGHEVLKRLNKKPGDRIVGTIINYKDDANNFLEMEMDILAEFPNDARFDQIAVMHRDYLVRALDAYKSRTGKPHPMADKMLNLVWVRLPNKAAFADMAKKLESGKYSVPAVKMESISSGIGVALEGYKDIVRGMRYLLAPAILITMTLVISNAISISVRERRTEMAVLKVLGFRPWMVMMLVLGESVLIGSLSGLLSGMVSYYPTYLQGGLKVPVPIFPRFFIPFDALWWGPALGAGAALAGSFLPAWSARSVKVSEVFSKVG
jgi:putative ABC transport system permease protein